MTNEDSQPLLSPVTFVLSFAQAARAKRRIYKNLGAPRPGYAARFLNRGTVEITLSAIGAAQKWYAWFLEDAAGDSIAYRAELDALHGALKAAREAFLEVRIPAGSILPEDLIAEPGHVMESLLPRFDDRAAYDEMLRDPAEWARRARGSV